MRQLRFQPQARTDLLEIWHQISRDSIARANRIGEEIEKAIRGLVQMPGMGHTRADVSIPHYRFWSVYSFVIAYRFNDRELSVVRVVHGARDFRALFKR